MTAWVLVLAMAMPSYDGGVGLHYVPFVTQDACEAAARQWNGEQVYGERGRDFASRGRILAKCHATGQR